MDILVKENPIAIKQVNNVRSFFLWISIFGFAVAASFLLYAPSLNAGFLLDDFKHVDYVYKAVNGESAGLLKSLTSNWTGDTDSLTAFRPGITMSFCLDYLLWSFNSVGYHITNILMFSGCGLLVGAIAFEIPSGKYGARVATALIASLLFLTYPLHVESVAWVIGRVDVNCTFFYLSSIYCYFRFRRQGSRMFLAAAIVLQLLALMSKEMAITLPCVLVLSELFLARCMDWKEATVRNRLFYLLGFLVMLAAFAVWRTLAIGVLVGGYGAGGLSALRQGLYNFCDVSTLQKIIYGVNEHRSLPEIFSTMAFSAWLVLLASLTIKGLIDAKTRWLLLFFAGWTVVANLPTFQIWHIFPNLVGSRLFFLGSAPLCILLALAAVSLVERPRKPMAILLAIVAFGAGLILSGTWAVALGHNLQSWQSAGKQTSDTRTFLVDLAGKSSEEQKILLVDLPQDFEGAGLIGRAEFLATLLSPPLSSHDLSGRVATTESPIPGQRDFIASEKLQLKARSKDVGPVLKWSDEKGKYIDWKIESVSKKTGEKSVSDTISSVTHKDFPIHFSGVEVDQFQWFAAEVDPFKVMAIVVSVVDSKSHKAINAERLSSLTDKLRLAWKSSNQPKSWIDHSAGPSPEIKDGKLYYLVGRNRNWLLNGRIEQMGLELPQADAVDVQSIELVSPLESTPTLLLETRSNVAADKHQQLSNDLTLVLKDGSDLLVKYDLREIPGAHQAQLLIFDTSCGPGLKPARDWKIEGALVNERHLGLKESVVIPYDRIEKRGKHQVVVFALDENASPVGWSSEPGWFQR